jgi:hypothetical protein
MPRARRGGARTRGAAGPRGLPGGGGERAAGSALTAASERTDLGRGHKSPSTAAVSGGRSSGHLHTFLKALGVLGAR